jgi:thioredoxin-like negative regulator of GroEL
MNKLIYISAPWCGPCRQFSPIMDKVSSIIPVQKMDADDDKVALAQYNVRSIPTIIKIDESGAEISRLSGVKTQQEVINFYNN